MHAMLSATFRGDLKLPATTKLLLIVPECIFKCERRKEKEESLYLVLIAEKLAIFLINIAVRINCWLY